jgi:hypothetical protein
MSEIVVEVITPVVQVVQKVILATGPQGVPGTDGTNGTNGSDGGTPPFHYYDDWSSYGVGNPVGAPWTLFGTPAPVVSDYWYYGPQPDANPYTLFVDNEGYNTGMADGMWQDMGSRDVRMHLIRHYPNGSATFRHGFVVRYIDDDNYVRVMLLSNGDGNLQIKIETIVAGSGVDSIQSSVQGELGSSCFFYVEAIGRLIKAGITMIGQGTLLEQRWALSDRMWIDESVTKHGLLFGGDDQAHGDLAQFEAWAL